MQPIEATEIAYYLAVWTIGAISGMARTGRDGDFNSISDILFVGLFSGLLAYATVSFAVWQWGPDPSGGQFYLGCACFVGLIGPEQTILLRSIWKTAAAKLRIEIDGRENESGHED